MSVLESGRLISGPQVEAFEEEFAEYMRPDDSGIYAVAVSSGTAALHLTLSECGIIPGDEVVIPAITFASTATAVLMAGGIPVFADINPMNGGLCVDDVLERRLTDNTKAIIVVDLWGFPADLDRLMGICKDRGLLLIEDAAQAHGSKLYGQYCGTFGHYGCFSFHATKHMTTMEGGMILTNSIGSADNLRRIRSHNMTDRHTHGRQLGYNYRMTEVGAAIGRVQLGKLHRRNSLRIGNTEHLFDCLGSSEAFRTIRGQADRKTTYFWAPVILEDVIDVDKFVEELRDNGVECRYRYKRPLYYQDVFAGQCGTLPTTAPCEYPDYRDFGDDSRRQEDCFYADRLAGRVIGLPNAHFYSHGEIEDIAERFLKTVRRYE